MRPFRVRFWIRVLCASAICAGWTGGCTGWTGGAAQVGPADAQVGPTGAQVGPADAQVGWGNSCLCDKMPKVHEFPLKFGIAEPKCLICTIIFTYNGKSPRKAAISAQNQPFYRKNRAKQRFLPTPVRNIDEIVQSSDFRTQSTGPHAGGRRSQRWVGISPAGLHAGGRRSQRWVGISPTGPPAGGRRSQRLDGCRSGRAACKRIPIAAVDRLQTS